MKDNLQTINDTRIIPKILPFRCPVCRGFGTVNWGKKGCNTCKGKGVILVDQEKKDVYSLEEIMT